MTEPETHELEAPGAMLHYDVRRNASSTEPVLLLIGSPMAAGGFVTLAGHFTDRTVVTYDPRGAERSLRTDDADETTPEEHADDLHRVIAAVGGGAVDLFATSGGAVNALVLVAEHPQDVRTLVAHEPPAVQELPDREEMLAACVAIRRTYYREGFGPAMARFIAVAGHDGPLPAGYADQPGPEPELYGLPAEDDGSRDNPLVGQNMITCTHHRHDFDALRAAPTRIVVAVGAESANQMPGRAARAVAARLGTDPVSFPGGHAGFLGGEYGQTGEPDGFAAALRAVLAS
ncbi:MAG TPA: alpha/beta hydrolase [Acidimicrobiales bacterium]|jgi:pimeloyl-ACP methyl ester carboxylesterase